MALTAKGRRQIKPSNFAIPPDHYPIDTPARARNALSRIVQNGSPAQIATVRRKVAAKYPGIKVSGVKKKGK